MKEQEIDLRFTHHEPEPGQTQKYQEIRETARRFAHRLDELCPDCRELERAIEALDDVVFNANAAIARRS